MLLLHDPKECGHGLQVVVRWLALEELDHGAPDAPDITLLRGLGHLDYLRCHPVRRPNNAVVLGIVVDFDRDSKVGELD